MGSGQVDPHVSLGRRGDYAAQIYRDVRSAILDGRLTAGDRLPPSREFAQRLSVSRNTVALAYERLVAEGLLVARVGSGTFVGDQILTGRRGSRPRDPEPRDTAPRDTEPRGTEPRGTEPRRTVPGGAAPHDTAPRQRSRAPVGGQVRPREIWRTVPPVDWSHQPKPRYDFRVGMPDPALFPVRAWRRLVNHELRDSLIQSGQYGNPAGYGGLRAAIASYIGVSRSVSASAEDVLITHGAQQALDLIGRVLIEPGNVVAVEEPGYPPARALFDSLGARVVGVPVDAEGIDVAAIPSAARLVYTTPSHQFPLGTPMSLARRAAILDWARRRDAVIIEDDYDSEFRFSGRPLDPLQSLDRDGRVLYVGSFSKTMLPMLRIGFLISPASLQPALRKAKQLSDWHGDTPTQAALARFINEGLLGRHIRRASREYEARHRLVEAGLTEHLHAWLEPVASMAGLHLTARLRPHSTVTVDDVVRRAEAAGIAVASLGDHYADSPPQPGIVIGYGGIAPADIPAGLRALADHFA